MATYIRAIQTEATFRVDYTAGYEDIWELIDEEVFLRTSPLQKLNLIIEDHEDFQVTITTASAPIEGVRMASVHVEKDGRTWDLRPSDSITIAGFIDSFCTSDEGKMDALINGGDVKDLGPDGLFLVAEDDKIGEHFFQLCSMLGGYARTESKLCQDNFTRTGLFGYTHL